MRRLLSPTGGRRHRAGVVAVAALTAVVAAAVTVAGTGGRVGAQLAAPAHLSQSRAPGSRAVDWGQLRLWLPAGWDVTAGPSTSARCWDPPARSVYLAAHPLARCTPTSPQPAVQVAPLTTPVPSGYVRSTIDGTTVWESPPGTPSILDVPSLGVTISAWGDAGGVVDSLGPSSLHAVLTERYPVRIPARWRTVRFDGFEARVPAPWPTRHVRAGVPPPGVCGTKVFATPAVFLGRYTGPAIFCPLITADSLLSASVSPTSGLWLQAVIRPSQATTSGISRSLRGHIHVRVAYRRDAGSNTLDVDLTAGGRTLETEVGLGVDPSVAEAVISSLRRVGAH